MYRVITQEEFESNLEAAEKRDALLFGSYDEKKYRGGMREFKNISPQLLQTLVRFGYADENDAENAMPSIRELLEFVKESKEPLDHYTFDGYVISPARNDMRVSIVAIHAQLDTNEEVKRFKNFFRDADDINFDDNGDLYAWYD